MGFDPVSCLIGKTSGGGGGGGNAYAYATSPSDSMGQNGEYYFELLYSSYISGLNSKPTMSANTNIVGWEFTANENITIVGAKGLSKSSYTGTIKLAASDGTVMAEKSIQLTENEWESIYFDSPVALTSGSNYIIMLFGNPSTLMYQQNPSTASEITYVCGRYGGIPGTSESRTAYSVDILIAKEAPPPYPIKAQYYKAGGVWVPV